jgi:hypothetical protein
MHLGDVRINAPCVCRYRLMNGRSWTQACRGNEAKRIVSEYIGGKLERKAEASRMRRARNVNKLSVSRESRRRRPPSSVARLYNEVRKARQGNAAVMNANERRCRRILFHLSLLLRGLLTRQRGETAAFTLLICLQSARLFLPHPASVSLSFRSSRLDESHLETRLCA